MTALRLAKVEEFEFEKSSDSRYIAKWLSGDRRYHVWYTVAHGLESVLHSNPRAVDNGRFSRGDHKGLDLLSARWLPMREDLLARITQPLIQQADKAYGESEAAIAERRQAAKYETAVAQVNKLIDSGDFDNTPTKAVFCALLTIPRDDLLRLI